MFGTNWPVDSLYSDYGTVLNSYRSILSSLSDDEQRKFFYQNAVHYYAIRVIPSEVNRSGSP